jgi:hypothetical protein
VNVWPVEAGPWKLPSSKERCGFCGRRSAPGRWVCARHAERIDSTAEQLRQQGVDWQAYKPSKRRRRQRDQETA